MTLLHRLASVVRWMVRRDRAERDLNDELEAFVDMAAADNMRNGAEPADARRSAVLHLGGVEQAKERVRFARHGAWLDEVGRDLRYGIRTLRRSPGFTAVALLTLALGIGANAAIFSILNAAILRPLGYPAPQQLMRLTAHYPVGPLRGFRLSMPEYLEFREMNRSFVEVGAFAAGGEGVAGGGSGAWDGAVNLMAGDRPLRARSALVDEHLLATLGVQPVHGRLFAPGETDAMSSRPEVRRSQSSRTNCGNRRLADNPSSDGACRLTAARTTSSGSCRPASTSWTTARKSGCRSACTRRFVGFGRITFCK